MSAAVSRVFVVSLMALWGCGGGPAPASDDEPSTPSTPDPAAAEQPPTPPPAPDDPALAEQGADLFAMRACNACHTIGGGRLVGPDLAGVTDRRSQEWIVAMIMSPDSMIRIDPTAKALFAEYLTPMADQNLSEEEARALYAFLRRSEGG